MTFWPCCKKLKTDEEDARSKIGKGDSNNSGGGGLDVLRKYLVPAKAKTVQGTQEKKVRRSKANERNDLVWMRVDELI